VLPGVIGSLQANEALKLIAGYGKPLVGRLLMFDAQATNFSEVKVRRDPRCPACGTPEREPEPSATRPRESETAASRL
jgi:bacteriocin biosynthesis cyclodehydratase domain-containing protein